jgi:hypothetical protein
MHGCLGGLHSQGRLPVAWLDRSCSLLKKETRLHGWSSFASTMIIGQRANSAWATISTTRMPAAYLLDINGLSTRNQGILTAFPDLKNLCRTELVTLMISKTRRSEIHIAFFLSLVCLHLGASLYIGDLEVRQILMLRDRIIVFRTFHFKGTCQSGCSISAKSSCLLRGTYTFNSKRNLACTYAKLGNTSHAEDLV